MECNMFLKNGKNVPNEADAGILSKIEKIEVKKYNRLILSKIEHSLNLIILIAIPLVLLLVINDYFRQNFLIMVVDSIITFSLIIITIYRHKFNSTVKISIIVLLTLVAGLTSMMVSGYAGAGFLTLLLGSLLIAGFLSTKVSIIYASFLAFVTIVFIALVYSGVISYDMSNPKFDPNTVSSWFNLSIVFIIKLYVTIVIIYTIRRYFSISLKQSEEQLDYINHIAYYDPLTGLPNKSKLMSLQEEMLRDAGFLAIFSIDGYRLMDSIYGEEVSNEIILAISELLKVKNDNILFYSRVDVNEFAFLWSKNNKSEFLPFVERSIAEVQIYPTITKWKKGIHIHLGYFEFTDTPQNLIDGYHNAKVALQESVINSGTKPIIYNQEIELRIKQEYDLKHAVNQAIINGDFVMHYQEKINGIDRQVIGVEALARWKSADLGFVSPSVFIPLINKSVLFAEFGNLVIQKVMGDCQKLREKYSSDLKISINISPQYLLSQDFISYILRAIDARKINPENIIFEITEEILIENIENAVSVLKELKKYGFKISLDDFGSGYSSLNYLSRLIFDEVKIDKSFIDHIANDPKIAKMIEIIVALKNVYGFDIVAEGVETEEQFNILMSMGDFIIQGYYFSKPQSIE